MSKPLSKDQYWARTGPIGFDNDIVPGLGYSPATNFYEPIPAEEYSVNIIVDPCRGHPYNCCQDVFGTPQYVTANATRVLGKKTALQLVDEKGESIPVAQSRLQDQLTHFDSTCSEVRNSHYPC